MTNEITEQQAREFVHAKYDDLMFCPKCRKLLTGLHMMSGCYRGFIEKEVIKMTTRRKAQNQ